MCRESVGSFLFFSCVLALYFLIYFVIGGHWYLPLFLLPKISPSLWHLPAVSSIFWKLTKEKTGNALRFLILNPWSLTFVWWFILMVNGWWSLCFSLILIQSFQRFHQWHACASKGDFFKRLRIKNALGSEDRRLVS